MKDDFDNGMGLPDDELTGGSAMSDTGEAGGPAETELDVTSRASSGRPSGGARRRKSSGARKSSPSRAAARRGARKSGKKAAKRAKKKGGARKAGKKTARRAGRKKR